MGRVVCVSCGHILGVSVEMKVEKMKAILNRLREPSSLAGLAVLAMMFGVPAGVADVVVQAVGGVAAAAAVLLPDRK